MGVHGGRDSWYYVYTADKKPQFLMTDGARNFYDAFKKEFYTNTYPRTKHIRHIHFKGDKNNNKMERFNDELRDREKTMRGLKKVDTPILTGYQIFHNYTRSHEGLDGKTPADVSGIKIEGKKMVNDHSKCQKEPICYTDNKVQVMLQNLIFVHIYSKTG